MRLLRETGPDAEPGAADLLDTELALDRGEYCRARAFIGTMRGAERGTRTTCAARNPAPMMRDGRACQGFAAEFGSRPAMLAQISRSAAAHA